MRDTRNEVGPYKPHGNTFHKEYIGSDTTLLGKKALVGFTFVVGQTVAQFDDLETRYGGGWHHFKHSDFWPPRE